MATLSLLVAINIEVLETDRRDEQAAELRRRLRELPEANLSTLAGANAPAAGSRSADSHSA